MAKLSKDRQGVTIGLDVGDRSSCLCVLDASGEIVEESKVPTTRKAIEARFGSQKPVRVVLETGTHAKWLHDALGALGNEVIVADVRRLRAISDRDRKVDRKDAETLARLGRSEVRLLSRVDPRAPEGAKDLEVLRARAKLVMIRTMLVNHIRGVIRSFGLLMPVCSASRLHTRALPPELSNELATMMVMLESTSAAIDA